MIHNVMEHLTIYCSCYLWYSVRIIAMMRMRTCNHPILPTRQKIGGLAWASGPPPDFCIAEILLQEQSSYTRVSRSTTQILQTRSDLSFIKKALNPRPQTSHTSSYHISHDRTGVVQIYTARARKA